jgi:hypothetical protein
MKTVPIGTQLEFRTRPKVFQNGYRGTQIENVYHGTQIEKRESPQVVDSSKRRVNSLFTQSLPVVDSSERKKSLQVVNSSCPLS